MLLSFIQTLTARNRAYSPDATEHAPDVRLLVDEPPTTTSSARLSYNRFIGFVVLVTLALVLLRPTIQAHESSHLHQHHPPPTTITANRTLPHGPAPWFDQLDATDLDWATHDRAGDVAIIGSAGYIGSRLMDHIRREKQFGVIGFDRIHVNRSSYQLPQTTLAQFRLFVYLGGLTGRVVCEAQPEQCVTENVEQVVQFAQRLRSDQTLVFASTAAINEGSGAHMWEEDHEKQPHAFDHYTRSMYNREMRLRQYSLLNPDAAPRMIGLRFGTVVGVSASQRLDFVHNAMVCSAFARGRIKLGHPESHRSIVWMEDLVRAIHTLIHPQSLEKTRQFDIFHLSSIDGQIGRAAAQVASQTRAIIDAVDHPSDLDIQGFTQQSTKFSQVFGYHFTGTERSVVNQLMGDAPRMCLGRESRLDADSVPCAVCGSVHMELVLDLGEQPLANDFQATAEEAMQCARFPLRLVRCPVCHHTQLSYFVDRGFLFSHYLYQSGTSRTLLDYFGWLADKIGQEVSEPRIVLEIASNDGSQLDAFRKRGWETHGIDPAANIAVLAAAKNHTIHVGFWGVDAFPNLPPSLGAIVAQNVFAHVEQPVAFLKAASSVMGPYTRLYIQTSQCEMFESGQFDTVYHEHISFFTAHSFSYAAALAGLRIVAFEITPIHGNSCLVTMQRHGSSTALVEALRREVDMGLTSAWFFIKFRARAMAVREWMNIQLSLLSTQGHTLVAYGAAAKGMVLMHYLLLSAGRWKFEYVVDDAPLKQGTFCPGTDIPVRPTAELSKSTGTPLVIVVFAWNFAREIMSNIAKRMPVGSVVHVILPFPTQQLLRLDGTLVRQHAFIPAYPLPTHRRRVVLISHFFNEELLLPYFIRHYAPMVDAAIMIDYDSTDGSADIVRTQAPDSWMYVRSRNGNFDAMAVDREVMDYERTLGDVWRIVVTTTEFVVHRDLRAYLARFEREHPTILAMRFHPYMMSGNDEQPLTRFASLILQRSAWARSPYGQWQEYGRYLHRCQTCHYSSGRHGMGGLDEVEHNPEGFLAKWSYTPWPEQLPRKLAIKVRIPESDKIKQYGYQHQRTESEMTVDREKNLEGGLTNFDEIQTDARAFSHSQMWFTLRI